jgi:RNA polymerase sigma factor for flagellar operon FliA
MSEARDQRIKEALALVEAIATNLMKKLGQYANRDDLIGHGHEAIVDVVDRFDPARGVSFRSYARLRFRGAMLDGLRRDDALPRGVAARLRAMASADLYLEQKSEEISASKAMSAQACDAKLSAFLLAMGTAYAAGLCTPDGLLLSESEQAQTTLDDQMDRKRLRKILKRAIKRLEPPLNVIVERHYFRDEDLITIAERFGHTKSWASRMHARAIESLAVRFPALEDEL